MKIQAVVIALAVAISIDAAPTATGDTLSKSASSNDKRSSTGFDIFDISARLMGRGKKQDIVNRNAEEKLSSERRRSVGTWLLQCFAGSIMVMVPIMTVPIVSSIRWRHRFCRVLAGKEASGSCLII